MRKSKILLPLITLGSIVPCLTVAVSCSNQEKIFETTEHKNVLGINQIVETVDKDPVTGEEIGVPTYSGDSVGTYTDFKFLGEVPQAITLKEFLDDKYDIQVTCTKKDVLMTLYGQFEVAEKQAENMFNISVHCSELASRANLDIPAGEYPISLQIIERETQKIVFSDDGLKLQLEAGEIVQDFSKGSYFPSMSEVKYDERPVKDHPEKTLYCPYVTVEYGGYWSFHSGERTLTLDNSCKLEKNGEPVESDPLKWIPKVDEVHTKNFWIDQSSNCCGTHSVYCEYYLEKEFSAEKKVETIDAAPFQITFQVNEVADWKAVEFKVGVPLVSTQLEDYQTHLEPKPDPDPEPAKIMPQAFNVIDKYLFGVEMSLHLQSFDLNAPSNAAADSIECYLSTPTNNEGQTKPLPYIEYYFESKKTGEERSYIDHQFTILYYVLGQCQYDEKTGDQIVTFDDDDIYTITLSIGSKTYCPGVYTPYTFNIKSTE